MKYSWSTSTFPIASIFSFRMMGLFLLIPVFSLCAETLQDATPALIGLAFGAYGLTQGLLQIPFGMLSDKIGRKSVITLGLVLFAAGSMLGACAESIYTMILARALQGTGAIGSVLIALLADLTPDEQRTKAMAVVGMMIGASFSLAMVLSPTLTHQFGLSSLFYLTAGLATLGLFLLHLVIPTPKKDRFNYNRETNLALFKSVISNRHLQKLNFGIFCQHFILTATFFSLPKLINQQMQAGNLSAQWHFYLPLVLGSFILMIPFIILAEKKQWMKPIFLCSVLLTAGTQGLLAFAYTDWQALCGLVFVYFIAFNLLEASLPSLVSKQANPRSKGTAMGIYSTSQFLSIFAGASLAGVLYQWHGSQTIFIANAVLALLWFFAARFMQPNQYLSTLTLHYSDKHTDNEARLRQLVTLAGVREMVQAPDEQVLYLRVEKACYVPGSAEKILAG